MPARLVTYNSRRIPDLVFPLGGPLAMIGRDPGNIIQLSDPKVSKKHAALRPDGKSWRIEDLKSSNGTFVNGIRVASTTLKHGDCIKIGSFMLYYLCDDNPDTLVPTHVIEFSTEAGQRTMV